MNQLWRHGCLYGKRNFNPLVCISVFLIICDSFVGKDTLLQETMLLKF